MDKIDYKKITNQLSCQGVDKLIWNAILEWNTDCMKKAVRQAIPIILKAAAVLSDKNSDSHSMTGQDILALESELIKQLTT